MFSDLKIVQSASQHGSWLQRASEAHLNLRSEDLVVKNGSGYPEITLSDNALEIAFHKLQRAYFVGLHNVTSALKAVTKLEEGFALEKASRALQFNTEIRLYELLRQFYPEEIYQTVKPICPTTFHIVQNDDSPFHVHSANRPRLDSIAYKPSSGILNSGSFVLGNLLDVNPKNQMNFFISGEFPYEVRENTLVDRHVTPIDDNDRPMFFYLDRILAHLGTGIVVNDHSSASRWLSIIWGETLPQEISWDLNKYRNRFVKWEKAA